MPQTLTSKGQVARRGQMNKNDMSKTTPTSRARDDLRTAYDGDQNRGPARNHKTKSAKAGRVKGRRLAAGSGKIPIR